MTSSPSEPLWFANAVRVTPDGVMTLVLNREAYASLGLQGLFSCLRLSIMYLKLSSNLLNLIHVHSVS